MAKAPRIIVYTGKGDVGKTSVAAATATLSAQRGHRTIVLSTDIAHSLADSFDKWIARVEEDTPAPRREAIKVE